MHSKQVKRKIKPKLKTNLYLRSKLEFLRPARTTQQEDIMKKFIAAILLTISAPCIAQTEVNSFFPGSNEGVTYFLPDTRIIIEVEASCITETPGEFYSYAERYLHVKNNISQANSHWDITSITDSTEGIPCKTKAFTIKLNNSTASNIKLNNKGIIESINTSVATNEKTTTASTQQAPHSSIDPTQYMTEEMLQATSTAKMAELTAKEIYAIRESKIAITRGLAENMPRDGAAITLMLQELDKQEKALTEMFTGRIDTVYHTFNYVIEPQECRDTTKAVLFRFSRKLGVLDKQNLAGEPIYFDIKNLNSVEIPTNEKEEKKKTIKKEGVCYNIPGRIKLEIYTRSKNYIEKEISVAQLGVTEVLSKSLFNKKSTIKVLFDTATGGIISIKKN